MEKRYYVLEYSKSAHCCFEATVMDRQNCNVDGTPRTLCECFELRDALDICETFNTVDEGGWL